MTNLGAKNTDRFVFALFISILVTAFVVVPAGAVTVLSGNVVGIARQNVAGAGIVDVDVDVRRDASGGVPRLVELHRLENEGDETYHKAVAELFHGATDPMIVLKWKDIYVKLEAAVDRCENVANIIESVIIKHT